MLNSFQVPLAPRSWPLPASVTYPPGGGRVPNYVLPTLTHGFIIRADADVPDGGGSGILCAVGDWISGFALYLQNGRLNVALSQGGDVFHLESPNTVRHGHVELGCAYTPANGDDPARLALSVSGEELIATSLDRPLTASWQRTIGDLVIGHDEGFPVTDRYRPPFRWNGRLHAVVFETPQPMEHLEGLDVAVRDD